MKLLRLCAQEIKVGQALPWGVRNEPGQLLLNKGFVVKNEDQLQTLLERGMYVDADEYEQEQQRRQAHAGAKAKAFDPFGVWADIQRRLVRLLQDRDPNPAFNQEISQLGQTMRLAISKDVDVGKFEMVQNESANYGVAHSLQTAFVACLVARRLGASEDECTTAMKAALTMNIAIIDLQNVLVSQREPLSDEQRLIIAEHPRRGRERLEELGVTCPDWLKAVEQHHVTSGGKPLPEGATEFSDVACLIHYVDVYLAKMSSRATRPALPTQLAAQTLFVSAGGATNRYTAAIVKEMGIYPPGTFVKLASGETAVVTRTGESAHAPKVNALSDPTGLMHLRPIERDTSKPEHKIVSTIHGSNVLIRLNRPALLGYAVD